MLKDRAYDYFIHQNRNCAETALLSISDEYGLNLTEADMVLVSGFGGGIGCGALCGVVAAVSRRWARWLSPAAPMRRRGLANCALPCMKDWNPSWAAPSALS